MLWALAGPASAQNAERAEKQRQISIPAGTLGESLVAVSNLYGINVLSPEQLVAGKRAPAITGAMSAEDAIQRLLRGSGLAWQKSRSGALIIVRAPTGEGGAVGEQSDRNSSVRLEEMVVREARLSAYRVEDASSGTLFSLPVDETPFNIGIVTEALIDELQLDTLEEAVLTNASVNRSHLHTSTVPGYFIRGFSLDPDRLGFLVNGVPVTSGDTPPAHTSALSRIEILKGTSALYYGAGEPAGVINYVYKEPEETARYRLQTTIGQFDEYRAELDATGSLGSNRLLYRFTLGWEDSKGVIDYDYSRDFAPTLQLLWKPTDATSVRLIAEYVEHEGNPVIANAVFLDGRYLIGPEEQYLGLTTDYENSDSEGVQLHVDHEFTETLKLKAQIGYKEGGRETGNSGYLAFLPLTIPGIVDREAGLAMRSAFDQNRSAESEYAAAHLAWDRNLFGSSHQFVVGLNYSRSEVTNVAFFNSVTTLLPELFSGNFAALSALPPSVNVFDPVAVPYDHRTNFGDSPPFSRDTFAYDNFGLNLQDAIDIPSMNLHVLIGLRYARSGFEDLVSLDTEGNPSFFDVGDEDQDAWVPRAGIVYDINDDHNVFFSYGESFNPPFSSSLDLEGNFITEPETGEQYELGWRGKFFGGRLSSTISLYELTKQNIIVPTGVPNVSSVAGEQRSRGAELDLSGKPTDGWDLYFSYAYTDTEVIEAGTSAQSPGDPLPGVPDNKLVFWNNFSLGWTGIDGLRFGYGLEYVSGSLAATVDFSTLSFGEAVVPSQGTVHNANLSYSRTTSLGELFLNLGVKNLTDRVYVLNTSNTIAAKRGQPRTVLLTASMAF
ncbi:MAG: TonB-dependent receptor [Pseudomonadota bacterium]